MTAMEIHRRRMERERLERKRRAEFAMGLIVLILLFGLLSVAGTMDFNDRVRDLGGLTYDPLWYEFGAREVVHG